VSTAFAKKLVVAFRVSIVRCGSVNFGSDARMAGGVKIGGCSYLGSGAVVVEDIPAAHVRIGNPARFLRMVQK